MKSDNYSSDSIRIAMRRTARKSAFLIFAVIIAPVAGILLFTGDAVSTANRYRYRSQSLEKQVELYRAELRKQNQPLDSLSVGRNDSLLNKVRLLSDSLSMLRDTLTKNRRARYLVDIDDSPYLSTDSTVETDTNGARRLIWDFTLSYPRLFHSGYYETTRVEALFIHRSTPPCYAIDTLPAYYDYDDEGFKARFVGTNRDGMLVFIIRSQLSHRELESYVWLDPFNE